MGYQRQLHTSLAKIIAVTIFAINISYADDEQEDAASAATKHVANIIYAPIAEDTQQQLSTKGLAKPEIDDAVEFIATEFADCVVSSLKKANNDEAQFAIELMATGATKEEISAYFDSLQVAGSEDPLVVYEKETESCIRSVEASYGLSEL